MKDSTSTEERREHMVLSPSKDITPISSSSSSEKTHLLKPCFTISIDGSEPLFPPQNRPTSPPHVSKSLSKSVSFRGYRLPHIKFKSWALKMSAFHKPTWKKAGIFQAVAASTLKICKDSDLVMCIAERWCPETKTFVFPWGETTVTLEDVMVLLGFSVLGSPVFAPLDGSGEETKEKLEKERLKIKREKLGFVTQAVWIKRFMNSGDDEVEHVAFLALWLSYFVFPSSYYHIPREVLSVAVQLSRGTRIALAPPVLAHLYAELTLLKDHIGRARDTEKLELTSLFKLVQVWTWERFKELQPKPNRKLKGEPRLALWDDLRQQPRTRDVRQILDNSKMESFEWRPYTKAVKNWQLPKFYPEREIWVPVGPCTDDEFISFARCIKVSELVGIDCVEDYFPNRVVSQFGLLQDVPCPVVNSNNLSKEASWEEYDKPIDGLTLYIPSRSVIPRVTSMFCDWWRKWFPQLQHSLKEKGIVESCETLKPRNIVGEAYDDMSTSGSKRQQKRFRDNNESSKVPSDIDKDDDSLTVAKVNGNKYSVGDASEPLCKKCRLEAADNNYSGPVSIRADVDKPLTQPETEETESKAGKHIVLTPCDETNPSHPPFAFSGPTPEATKSCEEQVDVYGSNVEKMTMIDYGSKETECSLHEDGTIAGSKDSSKSLYQIKLAIDETDDNLASGGINGDETSNTLKAMIQNPSDEQNIYISAGDGTQGYDCLFDDDEIGSEEHMESYEKLEDLEKRDSNTLVSPPETKQACDDELDVYGSNAEKMAMTDDRIKEKENRLHEEDDAMAVEKMSPNEKEGDDSLVLEKRSPNADNKEAITRQTEVGEGDY